MKVITVPELECVGYPVFQYRSRVENAARVMAEKLDELRREIQADTITLAFTGTSGALIAWEIERNLIQWQVLVGHLQIAKDCESSHRNSIEEHLCWSYDWTKLVVFVDDFISSGRTFRWVRDRLASKGVRVNCVCVTGDVSESDVVGVDYLICETFTSRQ